MALSSLPVKQEEGAPTSALVVGDKLDCTSKAGRGRTWFQRRSARKNSLLTYAEETDVTLTSSITSCLAEKIVLDSQGNLLEGCLKKSGTAAERARAGGDHTVSFSTVEIHSHEVILGDNPAVSQGPPLTIEWKSFNDQTISVDDYEKHRSTPRTKMEMLMPRFTREERLSKRGYSRGEMKQVIMELIAVKQKREKSAREGNLKLTLKRWAKLSTTRVSVGGAAATEARRSHRSIAAA